MEFLDKNLLPAAGFHYTNYKDVVCCTFCHVRLGQWKQEDNPFEEHKRWSPACAFIKGLFVGNKPVASNNEQYGRSRDVCGSSRGKYLCLYLFCYMYVFLIAFLTNFLCVLYSWTGKWTKTQWAVQFAFSPVWHGRSSNAYIYQMPIVCPIPVPSRVFQFRYKISLYILCFVHVTTIRLNVY